MDGDGGMRHLAGDTCLGTKHWTMSARSRKFWCNTYSASNLGKTCPAHQACNPRELFLPSDDPGSATMWMPYLDVTTVQSAGVWPFFGGVQMNWTAEGVTRTEEEPQFKHIFLRYK